MSGGDAILILGVGNPLLGDDGVGVHVVDEIRRRAADGALALPPGTVLVDGGTRGLDLLPDVASARALVLVDAAELHAPPGSVAVIVGEDIDAGVARVPGSPAGITDLLDVARFMGTLPRAVSLVGIQPAAISVGIGLSGPVDAALDEAIRTTIIEACRADARTRPASTDPASRGMVGAFA